MYVMCLTWLAIGQSNDLEYKDDFYKYMCKIMKGSMVIFGGSVIVTESKLGLSINMLSATKKGFGHLP